MNCLEQIAQLFADYERRFSPEEFEILLACDEPELLELLSTEQRHNDFRRRHRLRELLSMPFCLHLLGLMTATTDHDDAVASLLDLMIRRKVGVRNAASSAGNVVMPADLFPDHRATDQLLILLHRDNRKVSLRAAGALSEIDDGDVVERLRQQMGEGDALHQVQTAMALGWRHDEQAFPALIAACANDDWQVRELACDGLRGLADARAIPPLSHMVLEDDDWSVRGAAAVALGTIGGHEAITVLIEALRDPDEYVRTAVVCNLGDLQDPLAVNPLINILQSDADVYNRCSAIRALTAIGGGVEEIIAALRDDNRDVRFAAADALEELQDPRSITPLVHALDDPDPSVRYAAADTLSEIRSFRTDDPVLIEKIRRLVRGGLWPQDI